VTRSEFFKTIGIGPSVASVLKVESIKIGGEKALAAVVYPGSLSQQAVQNIKNALRPYEERHNIDFMVFSEGMRPVRIK
jgi:hypothetical protein